MKIKKGFDLCKVCNENVIISSGIENIDFSKVISLNESAACIFEKVSGKDFTEDDMVKALTDEYEVDETTARKDVANLLASWVDAGLVEK